MPDAVEGSSEEAAGVVVVAVADGDGVNPDVGGVVPFEQARANTNGMSEHGRRIPSTCHWPRKQSSHFLVFVVAGEATASIVGVWGSIGPQNLTTPATDAFRAERLACASACLSPAQALAS